MKEVRFDIWCPLCKHYTNTEDQGPCDDCLTEPGIEDSTRPIHWICAKHHTPTPKCVSCPLYEREVKK